MGAFGFTAESLKRSVGIRESKSSEYRLGDICSLILLVALSFLLAMHSWASNMEHIDLFVAQTRDIYLQIGQWRFLCRSQWASPLSVKFPLYHTVGVVVVCMLLAGHKAQSLGAPLLPYLSRVDSQTVGYSTARSWGA